MSTATSPTNIPARKSFAQVAAAAHKPIPTQTKGRSVSEQAADKAQSQPTATAPVQAVEARSPAQDVPASVAVPVSVPVSVPVQAPAPAPALAVAPSLSAAATRPADVSANDVSRLNIMMRSATLDDPDAQSSGLSSRKEISDTKSVASRTTFTLDEKESLRPDDSASMQAGADDDSPSESVIAGAKAPSNPDMRAFRDQLYEIDRTENSRMMMQRGPGQLRMPPAGAALVRHTLDPIRVDPEDQPPPSTGPPPGLVIPPDEKLQEALASPKDRLFVLKVEQDLIDFIKDSKENELQLPQTNAFYRMLCHKLAEYYFLGHVVDESMSAVRIFRLPHSRLPPPLIEAESKPEGSTPPPTNSTRKIMRRGDSEQGLFAKDSEGDASAGRPDTGNVSGSEEDKDLNKPRDKSALTREEREKQYAEVRARIFEDFSESKIEGDGTSGPDSKGLSRASSASGNRKKTKKRPKDDSFEARSAYSQFNGQSYVNQGYYSTQGNASYYPVMGGYQGFPGQAHQFSQQPPQGYAMHQGQSGQPEHAQQGSWPGQQFAGHYEMNQSMGGGMQQFGPGQFDPANGFQPYPTPGMANAHSQSTPRAQQSTLAGYYPGYQQAQGGMPWPQHGYPNGFNAPQMYSGGDNAQFAMYYPTQGGYAQQPDFQQHQQFPNQAFNAYQAAQFNPQSQSFIPRTMSGQWAPMVGQMPMQPRPGSSYASPRFSNASPGATGPRPGQQAQPQQQGSVKRPGAQQSGVSGGAMESITKWATPANLPPKPPPPSSQSHVGVGTHANAGGKQ